MDGILIVYRHCGHVARVVPKAAVVTGRSVSMDVQLEQQVRKKPWYFADRRSHLGASPPFVQSTRSVVTIYPSYSSLQMVAVRTAAVRAFPGVNEQMVTVLPFSANQRHDENVYKRVQTHISQATAAAPYQLKELLSAALANSHACQNWLNGDNLERARRSIAQVTRDLEGAAQLV